MTISEHERERDEAPSDLEPNRILVRERSWGVVGKSGLSVQVFKRFSVQAFQQLFAV